MFYTVFNYMFPGKFLNSRCVSEI